MQDDDDILEEIEPTPIRVIAFDCGGVLISNSWIDKTFEEFSKKFNLDHDDVTEIFYDTWPDIEIGKEDEDFFFNAIIDRCNLNVDINEIREYYRTLILLNEETLKVVRALYKKYDLYTLNNEGSEWMYYRIETFDLERYFKGFITSAFVGARKPDEKIYHVFLAKCGVPPHECLFIDDKEENLLPAHALGMKVIKFESAKKLVKDLKKYNIKVEVMIE